MKTSRTILLSLLAAAAGPGARAHHDVVGSHSELDSDSDSDSDIPLPLVVWHGLGDSYDRLGWIAEVANKVHEGTYTYVVKLGDSPSADSQASFIGNVSAQVDAVCRELAADPILSTAPAIDALGFSQGGVFLRAYVERCNRPPVRSLVTLGSPHGGVVELVECATGSFMCKALMLMFKRSAWSDQVQAGLVPAQYYRPPAEYAMYLAHSGLLADLNNERALKSASYGENVAALESFVAVMFEADTKVVPRESAWFYVTDGEGDGAGGSTPLRETQLYAEDWIGLRALDEKGGLHFRKVPGEHMHFDEEFLAGLIGEFFGPARKNDGERKGSLTGEL